MPRILQIFLLFLALLAISPSASCQTPDFVSALSGDKHPLTIKLKDLDSSWRRMSVTKAAGMDILPMLALGRSMAAINDAYYTHGETIAVGSETFLVSYHYTPTLSELNDLSQGKKSLPLPQPPDTLLTLSLINVRQISSLDDVRPNTPEMQDQSLAQAQVQTQKTVEETSVENLKQIGMALLQYTQDADEDLPPMRTVAEADEAIYPFLKDRTLFEHPGTHQLYQTNTSLSQRNLGTFKDPARMVLYFEASPGDDGKRAVLFLDGHVKRIPEAQWPALKAASHVPNPPAAMPSKDGK